ncbi:MAG TPA: hypothetical protein VIF15_11370 [Polyangiaceae bacterium]|jgi:hypothetical protein
MKRALGLLVASGAALAAGCAAQPASPPRLVLAEAAPAESVPPSTAQPQPQPQPATTRDHGRQHARTLGWISLAVGSEAAVVAVATSFVMLHDQSQRDSNCDAHKVCSQPGFDANSNLAVMGGWNAGAWVVAAVGLGVGAYLLLTNPADDTHQTAIGVSPGGLTLRSHF